MLSKRIKQAAIKEHQAHETDTGSAEVQIGLLSKQIKALANHLKKHPKDHQAEKIPPISQTGKRKTLR